MASRCGRESDYYGIPIADPVVAPLGDSWAVINAVRSEDQAFPAILASNPISKEFRGIALKIAAKKGNDLIVKALLSNGPVFEKHQREAIEAAQAKRHPAVAHLIATKALISNEQEKANEVGRQALIIKPVQKAKPQPIEKDQNWRVSLLAQSPMTQVAVILGAIYLVSQFI